MADYREISQEYAQGAIKASVLLNGGAALALLTQLSAIGKEYPGPVLWSTFFWAVGVALGALCWLLAFISTRYVDKYEREHDQRNIIMSDRFMTAGMVFWLISIALFLCGAVYLAMGFSSAKDLTGGWG